MKQVKWLLVLMAACMLLLAACGNGSGDPTDATDTQDTGPRLAQKEAMAATSGVFADVFEACTENDKWITVNGVKDYWNGKYPNSVYPFRVHAQAYTNPTAIATVHTGVHYLQPGYNEIGIVSAARALEYLR